MADMINGWTPPLIYDLETDRHCIATQEDVDRLVRIARAYSGLVYTMTRAVDEARSTARGGGNG